MRRRWLRRSRLPSMQLGASAVVVGAGMIGLLVIQALRAAGCGQIIAVDVDEDRLALARTLGADIGLNSASDDVVAEVLARTSGRGAGLGFEVVGLSPTLNLALKVLRKGASLVMVGNLSPKVEFPLQVAVTRELTLYGSCASRGEYPACLGMIARGAIDVKALISVTAPLSEGASWFRRLYEREPGLMKVILNP